MASFKERLQDILLRDSLIKEEDLEKALQAQKDTGGELSKILVKLKLVSEDDLARVLGEGLGMPPIDISRFKVDPDIVKILPEEIVIKYQVLPISKIGNILTLAMADPLNIFVLFDITKYISKILS